MRTTLLTIVLSLFAATSFIHSQTTKEDFKTFLNKFTSSASFQYERVKFPLDNPIILQTEDGEEKEFPFTKDKWPLLDSDSFYEERVEQAEGSVYVAKFVLNEPTKKEFEAGYEESEIDLRVVFELMDNKWYVTDCYNGWYSFDLPAKELDITVEEVKDINEDFIKKYP